MTAPGATMSRIVAGRSTGGTPASRASREDIGSSTKYFRDIRLTHRKSWGNLTVKKPQTSDEQHRPWAHAHGSHRLRGAARPRAVPPNTRSRKLTHVLDHPDLAVGGAGRGLLVGG